jgi:hypothetical protein
MDNLICFLEGFIVASILAGLVIWRCEQSCTTYIHAAKRAGRSEGFAEGYNLRAKIAVNEKEKQ